jgi:hypothetical protein
LESPSGYKNRARDSFCSIFSRRGASKPYQEGIARSTAVTARHSEPRASFWSVLGSILARGEIALPCTPSWYFLFVEWCSVLSFSELRRWRRRGHGRRSIFPAGAPPCSPRIDLSRSFDTQRP